MTSAASQAADSAISPEIARTWIDRWDAQQQNYMPDREQRFTALIDAVEAGTGRPDPLILDLGSGPGSLSVRLLRRLPDATVVAIDADPLTLGLGRAAWHDLAGLRFEDVDLRTPGWSAKLGLDRQPDAAVSTTALHWLTEPALVGVYTELAATLRPGGLVLNGDHMVQDHTAARLGALERALIDREEQRQFPDGHSETWEGWWAAVAADPVLAKLSAERDARRVDSEHHGSPAGRINIQVAALRTAGFAEVGTLWQRGENKLLCGVLPD